MLIAGVDASLNSLRIETLRVVTSGLRVSQRCGCDLLTSSVRGSVRKEYELQQIDNATGGLALRHEPTARLKSNAFMELLSLKH